MKTSASRHLQRLRALRDDARLLTDRAEDDLRAFLHTDRTTFRHRPKADAKGVDVSTTATVLLALAQAGKLDDFYKETAKIAAAGGGAGPTGVTGATVAAAASGHLGATGGSDGTETALGTAPSGLAAGAPATDVAPSPLPAAITLDEALKALCAAPWESSGLLEGNFFTRALVLRALGFVGARHPSARAQQHLGLSLQELADTAAKTRADDTGALNGYPITPALGYWLFDAIGRLEIDLDEDTMPRWAEWSAQQFYSQISHVVANDDAMMDPVAMAMAACLANRLRTLLRGKNPLPEVEKLLPSRGQLAEAIPRLFQYQGRSGVWQKYFPLFIYPKDSLVNHLFTFELLEAILQEFPSDVLAHEDYVRKLETSVAWCRTNRQDSRYGSRPHQGWNSGSNLVTLRDGIPECWATAAVHMFLFKLQQSLTEAIGDRVLACYRSPRPLRPTPDKWDKILDIDVNINGTATSVKGVLDREIVDRWATAELQKRKRSALLFGPPGTSKTSLVKALAAKHGWPCISIDPSHFLDRGIEHIHERTNEVFEDLLDIEKAVVFFDEMDPLVKERKEGGDFIYQSLTTVFLPKLAKLYEQNKVVFFMATNHFKWIDSAIKRPGRFDYHICIGPPSWARKLKSLADDAANTLLNEWVDDPDDKAVLDRYTYDETRALFDHVRGAEPSLAAALNKLTKTKFIEMVKTWGRQYILLWKDDAKFSDAHKDYEMDGVDGSKPDKNLSKRN